MYQIRLGGRGGGGGGGGGRGETGVGQGKREEVGLWRKARGNQRGCDMRQINYESLNSEFSFFVIADNILHLDVHYVCYTMLVQSFELQGRHFTNFHYYF